MLLEKNRLWDTYNEQQPTDRQTDNNTTIQSIQSSHSGNIIVQMFDLYFGFELFRLRNFGQGTTSIPARDAKSESLIFFLGPGIRQPFI